MITQVNSIYSAGYDLQGNTGANFFTGTNAGTIAVNASLVGNPSALQASGVAGQPGNNQIALALAQLANATQTALGNQTFSQSYTGTITGLGSSLATANSQLNDQQLVQSMMKNQRNSVSGVNMDEEMTNLQTYEKAYQGSAELVTSVDQMLTSILAMKQLP
jgi:flagellar hook-associated protein 1 FlgK